MGRLGPAAREASADCRVTEEMVRPAAVNSASGWRSGFLVRGSAGGEAAAFVCCGMCVPPSSVSIPAGVSRPGGGAPSDALARTSPSTAPLVATRPASSSGNCQAAAAVPSARGVASAVSRDAAPGVDNGKSRASSDAGTGRAATRRELQPEGQTQADAFSRICAAVVRQKTVHRAISAKILPRNTPLPYPSLRRDSLSFEKVVSALRSWHSPCLFLRAWTP
jgi:hypothetical protein